MASEDDSSWPYITLGNFEAMAKKWRKSSGIELMSFLPLVSGEQLATWGNYSVESQDWIDQSFEIDGTIRPNNESIPSQVYRVQATQNTVERVNESGINFAAPVWQLSPPPVDPSMINFNAMSVSWLQAPFETINDTKAWVMSFAFNVSNNTLNATGAALQSSVLSPIFEKENDNSSDLVGFIWSRLPWERYLDHSVPLRTNGIVCVLQSSCLNESQTYEIQEGTAIFIGSGDQHDEDFDYYVYTFPVNGNQPGLSDTSNDMGICTYWFHVYPSPTFADTFLSSSALTAALWMALLFFLVVLSFYVYEYYARQRNDKIIGIAVSRSSILATLFPANVRERMYAEQEDSKYNKLYTNALPEQMRGLLPGTNVTKGLGSAEDDEDEIFKTRPIADLCKHSYKKSEGSPRPQVVVLSELTLLPRRLF